MTGRQTAIRSVRTTCGREGKSMTITDVRRPVSDALRTINLSHLKRLTTDIGVWQHCKGSEPNVAHGYSIDDVARALIVAVELWEREMDTRFALRLAKVCLRFLEKAILPDGRFHNFADSNGNWVDSVGSDDSYGRTIWALARALKANIPAAPAERIQPLLDIAMRRVPQLGPYRSKAFVLQAMSYLPDNQCGAGVPLIKCLEIAFKDNFTPDWQWYEPTMTYCNARLPLALLLASNFSPHPARTVSVALQMLDFLLECTIQPLIGGYAPVGNDGWFHKGDLRPPIYDQQPVDAGVLVEACVEAHKHCDTDRYALAADEAMQWYYGRNVHEISVYDESSGGVFDALTCHGVNLNQGAESILSYCLAAIALDGLK
jgi:hypothetical protein